MGGKIVGCMIGRPFAGKGYVSRYLKCEFDIPTLSMSEILSKSRDQSVGSETPNNTIGSIMKRGEIVPVRTVISLLRKEIEGLDTDKLIVDGFPRTIEQASFLETQNDFEAVAFYLRIKRKFCIKRMDNAFKLGDRGLRNDDNMKTIIKRHDIFDSETFPVIKYLKTGGIVPVITLNAKKDREFNASIIMKCVSDRVLVSI